MFENIIKLKIINKLFFCNYKYYKLDFHPQFNINFFFLLKRIIYKPSIFSYMIFKKGNYITYVKILKSIIIYTNFLFTKQQETTSKLLKIILQLRTFKLTMNFFNNNLFKHYLIKLNNVFNFLIFNLKWILLAGIISFFYFFISLFYIQIDLTKQLTIWYILFIVYFLLMSTFNSFLNKYKYGKFTSAIQRFWKRTGIIFWLIEGFLFLLFFYYFLNSSQEPLYMFDYSNLNQEYTIQLKSTYKNTVLLALGLYLCFILILNINFMVYSQIILLLTIITTIIFFSLYIESYQFIYILNIFADKDWVFDEETQMWSLELEENALRVKQQYFVLCLIAKYWHFIFIFISWFFFYIKSLETSSVSITMLGYNTQNLLILYILNLLCLVQWIKVIFKKFLEITYYWFFIQYDEKFFFNFTQELINSFISFVNVDQSVFSLTNVQLTSRIFYLSDDLNVWKC